MFKKEIIILSGMTIMRTTAQHIRMEYVCVYKVYVTVCLCGCVYVYMVCVSVSECVCLHDVCLCASVHD